MSFFKGALKIAVAIVLAIAALSMLGGTAAYLYEAYQRKQAAPFEEVKTHWVDLTDSLQLKLIAKTKLVEQRLYAEFNFQGYPSYLEFPANRGDSTGLTLIFQDKDGFKIFEKFVALHDISAIHNKGVKSGLSYEFNEFMGVDTYRRISQATVSWHLSLEPPKAAAGKTDFGPDNDPLSLFDHCAPNISKPERLKRLGKYGAVRQTGMGEYTVGEHKVHYLGGGSELYDCR
jgi:hypothetical protein